MSRDSMKRHASCSCGNLSLVISGDPVRVSVCHCFECQKRSGSVFAAQVRYAKSDIVITGEPSTYTRTSDSGNLIHFQFCSNCGGTIRYFLDQDPDNIAVPVGMFSDPMLPQPSYSVYEERMHHWVTLPENMEHVNQQACCTDLQYPPNVQLEWTVDPGFGFAAAKPTLPQPPLNMVLGGVTTVNQVYSVWDFYDCPRTGIADFQEQPHHFECTWDEALDDYSEKYNLRRLPNKILTLANEYEKIWQEWLRLFHAGKTSGETHPKGTNARFDELAAVLDNIIMELDIVCTLSAKFTVAPEDSGLPTSSTRKMHVHWYT